MRRARRPVFGAAARALGGLTLAGLLLACGDASQPRGTEPASAREPAERARALAAGYRERFPLPPEPWSGLGDATDARRRLAPREAELLGTVLGDPAPDPDLLLELGAIYVQAEEHSRAVPWILRALERVPDGPNVWLWLGADRLHAGEPADAAVLLRYAAALAPDSAPAYRFLGEACKESGDGDAALAAFERALELRPDDAEALWERAALLEARGEAAEARRALERLLWLDPDHPSALFLMARLVDARGAPGDAERAADFRARHERATLLDDLGLRDSGLPRAVQQVELGVQYIRRREPEKAERELREALPQLEDPAVLGNALAGLVDCLLRQDRGAEIEEPLRRLEEIDPGHPGLPTLIEEARRRGLR